MYWFSSHEILFQQMAIFLVLALSFQVVLHSGVFSFASVGFYGIGGYAAANLANSGMPLVPLLIVVIVGAAILAYLLALPLVRLRGLYLGMATFAFNAIVLVLANNGGVLTGGPTGLYGVPPLVGTGAVVAIAIVAALLVSQLERRAIGRRIVALRADESLARSMGIEVVASRNFLFTLSAVLGALAGTLNVLAFSTISPLAFDFNLLTMGLTMAVLGGTASWAGALIGTVIIVWFPEWFHGLGPWSPLLYGVLVVVVVCLEPRGIFGLLRAGLRALRRRQLTTGKEAG